MTFYYVVSLCVMAELLVGQLLFFYVYKKRKYFYIRYPVSVGVCLVLALFFPSFDIPVDNLYSIIKFIVFFAYSVVVYTISFNLKFKVTLSLCSAGYALQHIVYQLSNLFHKLPFGEGFSSFVSQNHRLVEIAVFVVAYTAFFLIFYKRMARWDINKYFNNALNFFSVFIICVCIILSLCAGGIELPAYASFYAIICCSLALVLQFAILGIMRLNKENVSIKLKMESDVVRYESIKDAINIINIKCHDLKKELNSVKDNPKIAELKNTIALYDSIPDTGNVIIDNILTNATWHYNQSGVTFAFSGRGEWLDFVDESDLKSLFLNAVSNAAEAAAKADPDKRSVSIVLEKKGEMVILSVRNYYVGEPVSADKLPASTKTENIDEHGFGLKSMQLVAKRYHGEVMATGTGSVFTLNVYLINN